MAISMKMEWISEQKTAVSQEGMGQSLDIVPRSTMNEGSMDELRFRR